MIYVALLRGINVGGKNKVDMKELKATFEQAGMSSVTTYINSGNVIFANKSLDTKSLTAKLENAIKKKIGFAIKLVIKDIRNIHEIAEKLPDTWKNDDTMKCDVLFLWDKVNTPDIVKNLIIKPDIDDVVYTPGAILWRVDRKNVTRSGLMKIIGTDLYGQVTIRNCNTVRKLSDRMKNVTE